MSNCTRTTKGQKEKRLSVRFELYTRVIAGLVFLLLALPVFSKEPVHPTLRYVAGQISPPFLFQADSGEYTGVLPDLLSKIVEPMGYQVKYSHTPGGRAFSELAAGYGDLMNVSVFADITLNNYPENLLICSQPFITVPFQIFSLRPELIGLPVEAIAELRIGVIRIASPTRAFKRTLGVNNLYRYTNNEQIFKALMSKRIDLAFMNLYSMEYLSESYRTPLPYQMDLNLGLLKFHFALTRETERRLGIFDNLCHQVEKANELGYVAQYLRKHKIMPSQ